MANLLIVDDNAGLREGISSFFREQGHQSMTAGGVTEAVEMIRRQSPDLVLSDFVMDDGTGLGLRKQIRQLGLRQDPYFILLTGHPTLDNAREAYYGGVDLYLTKPFQLPALALAVDNGLRKRPPKTPDSVLRTSEAFYHDFFLILNPVLPRLLMLMEGRYGGLGMEQVASISSIFDTWRRLLWTMADFYERIHEADGGQVERRRWSGPPALKRILDKLQTDLSVVQLQVDVIREPRLPLGCVHAQTAEAILEAVILRLAAFSAPGSTLSLAWNSNGKRLQLTLKSDQMHQDLTPELMRNVALLPPVLPLLEEAGVRIMIADNIGPWVLSFEQTA
jgi:CheY-like chemotaxis protein